MSQLRVRIVTGLIFFVLLTFISGCSSSKNENAPFSGGSHPSGWLPAGHMTAARTNVDACLECHGSDLGGGISRVSCTSCHLGGTMSVHPASWGTGTQIALNHAPYVATNGTTGCQNNYCHGSTLAGVGGSGPSCSSCHLGGATSVHPLDWSGAIMTKHGAYVDANTTSGCANAACHGTNLDGISGSGPSCTSCHLGGVMSGHPADWADPIALNHGSYVQTNGTSGCATENCHGTSLSGVSGSGPSCTSCHLGGTMSVHPASWGTGTQIALNHAPYVATNGTTGCQNNYCHGSTLAGVDGSGPSCSSCHLGGATSVHPLDWSGAIMTKHGAYASSSGTGGCATETCHGTSLSGVSGSGPSCTSCHIGGAMSGHPADWGSAILTKHGEYAATNGTGGCATEYCHGKSLSGVSGSGPGCQSCHQYGVYPFTATGCTSCHGIPPSGTTFPDQANAHNTVTGHFASQVSLPDGCTTCHVGQGVESANHFNGVVDVQLLASVYSSLNSSAVYNSEGTCSSVSCHGGKITPIWNTGSIDVNNGCTDCHSFCTEYNGYCSGQHGPHVNEQNIYCTECHDPNKLVANHFTTLNTLVMEGPVADTIADGLNYSGGSCTPSCHAKRDWLP